jgi:hypothetical protein
VATAYGPVAVAVLTSLPSTVTLQVTVPPDSPAVTMSWPSLMMRQRDADDQPDEAEDETRGAEAVARLLDGLPRRVLVVQSHGRTSFRGFGRGQGAAN